METETNTLVLGDRFYGERKMAWDEVGKTFTGTDVPTVAEAFAEANLGYQVKLAPMYTKVGETFLPVPGRQVLIRMPNEETGLLEPQPLGEVGRNYEVIQNAEIASLIQPLADEWPIHAVGAKGNMVFVVLRSNTISLNGDELAKYFLIIDRKGAGNGSLRVMFTPVRIFCTNCLVAAMGRSTSKLSINHVSGALEDLRLSVGLLAATKQHEAESLQVFERMGKVKPGLEGWESLLEAAWKYPNEGQWEAQAKNITDMSTLPSEIREKIYKDQERMEGFRRQADRFREAAAQVLQMFNDSRPQYADTVWAMYNSIVEVEDFRRGTAGVEFSVMAGGRAHNKERAYAAALALLK